MCLLIAQVLTAAGASSVAAQDEHGSADSGQARTTFETMTVIGERIEGPTTGIRDASAFATTFERDDFAGRGMDLGEILDSAAGVQIRTFGGVGDFSTISIRGSTAQQVEIFLDGIPMNRAIGGGVDLSTIPLANVERVEVYRGTAPARLAVTNVGGAVELTSVPAGGAPRASLMLGGGSFGTFDAQGNASGTLGSLGLLAAAGYARTDGDFEFLDDNGTPFNPSDDERVKRVNNAFEQVSALVKGDLELPGNSRLTLASDFFYKDEGVPGIGTFQSRVASLETLREIGYLQFAGRDWADGLLDLSERLEVTYQSQRFRDLNGEIGTGSQDNDDRTFSYASVTESTFYPIEPLALTALVDLRREEFQPRNELLAQPDGPESIRDAVRLAFEAETSLLDDRLIVDPVVRFAYFEDERASFSAPSLDHSRTEVDREWTWKIGARGELTHWLDLRGNVSTSFRPPSFAELFGDRGSIIGNPNLESERGFSWDVGFDVDARDFGPLRHIGFQVVYFHQETEDLILFIQNSQRTAVAQNVSDALSRGVELSLWADFPYGLSLTSNATFQKAEDRSRIPSRRGKDLPGQPREDVFTRLAWSHAWLTVHGEFQYVGKNYLDPGNFAEVEERFLLSAGLEIAPWGDLRIRMEGRNLTDDQVSDVFGFPLPGTSFFGSVEYRFDGEDAEYTR